MKRWFMSKSITIKIAMVFILLNFLITGVLTVVLYRYFQQVTRSSVESALDATISANDSRMRETLKRIKIAIDLVHNSGRVYQENDPSLTSIADFIISFQPEEDNSHLVKFLTDYEANTKLFNDYFKTCFGEEGDEYSNIFFVETSWPIARYLKKQPSLSGEHGFKSAREVENTDWYQQARLLSGEPYWFAEENYIYMAKALEYQHMHSAVNVESYDLGVLVTGFPVSMISGQLDMNALTQDSEVLLTDSRGFVIWSSDGKKTGEKNYQLPGNPDLEDIQEVLYEGRNYLVSLWFLPLDVRIFTAVPLQDVYRMASQTIRIIGIAGVLMILLAVILTVIFSVIIVTPLRALSDHMEAGNTDELSFDFRRKDEIGILYESFNHLISQLKDSMTRELSEREDRIRAEFCALQVQINPHYIYNTLNSISCLSLLKGQDDIAELIGNLTKVIRYNINDPTALVPLSKELDTIRQYENIQMSCYGNRIRFEYDVEEKTMSFMIPKLIIQPLVENAIFHGMDADEKLLVVSLLIRTEGDRLLISVSDNGKRADTDRINLYVTGQLKSNSNGLGVHNIYERLQIIYGKESTLHYQKDENGNTLAIIRIPYPSGISVRD